MGVSIVNDHQLEDAISGPDNTAQAARSGPTILRYYVAIARPDHWFKNIFMLPGAALALVLGPPQGWEAFAQLALAIISTCLVASANYTINEWLDAEFDRHHPIKKSRPSAIGYIRAKYVILQWALLAAAGLAIGAAINLYFFQFSIALLIMGLVYNVRPLRTKDRPFLDVLSESINNPLRFLLGWAAITTAAMPPVSVLLAYWMGGAFLMAIKRFAEYRFIDNPERASLYRRSFKYYTENSLLLSSFFYGFSAAFFLGVFLIKYRIEFLLSVPAFSLLFVWYLAIGMQRPSAAQSPEKLYKEKGFVAYVVFLGLLVTALFFIDIPWLNLLVEHHVFDVRP